MRSGSHWWSRLFIVVLMFSMVGAPIVSAQDGTPVASPAASPAVPDEGTIDSASPEASPAAATCEPFTSATSAEVRAELESKYPIEAPTTLDSTYITGATGDLQSINPFLIESDPSSTVAGFIFDPLLAGNPENGQPTAGGVTDYYEIAADCITYTFHLRTDKVWSDGSDLTADDVAFSFESMADESLASPYTGSFLAAVASWQVIDADTIQVVATDVLADFLTTVGFSTQIIKKSLWENIPRSEWVTDPGSTGQDPSRVVGTGPFKFESWTQGQEIKLVRNDLYTPMVTNLAGITIRIYADNEAQFNAFLTGELDDVALEPAQLETVQQQTDQFRTFEYPNRGFTYYEFNLNPDTTVRFQDYRVRQAFMFALDRQSIVDNILLGHGVVANGPQPVISYAYAPDQMNTIFNYDPERAKSLLAEAGWTDTNGDGSVDKDGVEMSFEFLYPSGDATLDTLVAYMQDAWKQVGIDITPRGMEFSALIEATTTTPTFEMALYGFSWDSTFFQDVMFGCDMYQIGFNDMKYCNPDLDVLGEQIKRTINIDERIPLMIQYSNIVNDEQPIGVLHFSTTLGAENLHLKNSFPGPWGGPGIEYVWIADE